MNSSAWIRKEDNTYGHGKFPFGRCQVPGCQAAACYEVPAETLDEDLLAEAPANDNDQLLICLGHRPKHLLFVPFLGQQTKLWTSSERWVLGGGGAGGAKTELGSWLWLKLYHLERQRYEAGDIQFSRAHFLFLRRTIPEVLQVIERFRLIFRLIDPAATWDADHNIATFPSAGGMKVQFGGCKDEDDWQKYWGHEYTIIVLDEATMFTLKQIKQLYLRLRSADPVLDEIRQIYLLTNPIAGKSGVETKSYLKARFVRVAEPETTVVMKTKLLDGREDIAHQVYIPCNLYDNAALMATGTYEADLRRECSPSMMRALLANDWDVDEGAWIGDDWDRTVHVCEPFALPANAQKRKSLDYGYNARSSVLWFARLPGGGEVGYRSLSVTGQTAAELAATIKEIESKPLYWVSPRGVRVKITDAEWDQLTDCSTVYGPADRSLWHVQGEAAGGQSRGEVLDEKGCGFYRGRADNTSRADAADQIRMRLRHRVPDPFAEGVMVPMTRFFSTCETKVIRKNGSVEMTGPIHTIPNCPADERNPDVWDTTADDHDIDAWAYDVLANPMGGADEEEPVGEVIEMFSVRAETPKAANCDW